MLMFTVTGSSMNVLTYIVFMNVGQLWPGQ